MAANIDNESPDTTRFSATAARVPVTVTGEGRQTRGDKRREAMLLAARDLFVERGYRNTSLRAIIERAGGSREMIYSAFGGKAGLLSAIIADAGQRLTATFTDEAWEALSPREALTRLGINLMEIWCSPEGRAVNRLVMSEGPDAPEILERWYRGGVEPFLGLLSDYIGRQRLSGALDVADPLLMARQFRMLLMGELAFPIISPDPVAFDPAAAVARCVALLMRAHELH
jgi:TetR/AcrR family transcriptional repressor of mexJK operon